jgi:putative copper resistance protein D
LLAHTFRLSEQGGHGRRGTVNSQVATGVQSGPLDLCAQVLIGVMGVLYLAAVRRRKDKTGRWPVARTAAFFTGLVVLWLAVGSDLAAYDNTSVEAHTVQHLLLMMMASPLLVLGRPVVLASQASGRRIQVGIARLVHGRTGTIVTQPVLTWFFYLVPMAVAMTDRSVYGYLVTHDLAHAASHLIFVAAGVLYWEPLLGPPTLSLPPPARVISILANMPFEVLIGIALRYRTAPLGPTGTLADTQAGGEAFIVGATLLSTVWLAWVVVKWAAAALREERRSQRRPPRLEWTTPWWVKEAGAGPAPGPPSGPAG